MLAEDIEALAPYAFAHRLETAPGVEYALVGCAVAPGFEYGDFELGDRETLLAAHPRHQELVLRFT